jgi:uncharacterized protein YndB with AHSA1/START domain
MSYRTVLAALAALFAFAAAPAHAEVVASATGGFTVRHVVAVAAPPAQAWRRFTEVGRWWNDDHTFSGSARNLSLAVRPGGCWCEKLDGGGFVRHMEVIYAAPGEMLRLSGGLGPLQDLPVSGVMTVKVEADGAGSKVTLTYAVGGNTASGLASLAPAVDGVLGQQMTRYAAFAGERR